MQPRKAAIIHPRLQFGGSEARALWGVEALKREFDVTLITGGPVDLDRLNRYYGTALHANKFSVRIMRMPLGLHRTPQFASLRGAFLQRYLRRIATQFDVMISAYNPCDFGVRGIQFIADFSFVRDWRTRLDPATASYRKWWYGKSPLRSAYLGLSDAIAGPRTDAWKRNVTVANSAWSAAILLREFGIESRVVYPPVAGGFPDVPWQQRESGFVCVGRVVPEKRMDAAIEILSQIRGRGHNIHLHILGDLDDSPFGKKIRNVAARHRGWVFLEGRVGGKAKQKLMSRHKFGISVRANEPFGIAAAELVKAGCITFVPRGGGQAEIVGHPALTFADDNDGLEKIDAMLSNLDLQKRVRDHLFHQASTFSAENFQEGFRAAVRAFLGAKDGPTTAERPSLDRVSLA